MHNKSSYRNQHFVPQFYLRNFSQDGKSVSLYLRDRGKIIPSAPIKTLAAEDYFYSTDPEIEHILAELEENSCRIISKLLADNNYLLSKNELDWLRLFILIQYFRTPRERDTVIKITDGMNSAMDSADAKLYEEYNIHYTKQVLEFTDQATPACLSLLSVNSTYKYIEDLSLSILVNNTNYDFITSDNPCAMYNLFYQRMLYTKFTFLSKGVFLYLPISSKIALLLYDNTCYRLIGKRKASCIISNPNDILCLNRITLSNCFKTVIFHRNSNYTCDYFNREFKSLHQNSYFTSSTKTDVHKTVFKVDANYSLLNLSLKFLRLRDNIKHIKPAEFSPQIHGVRAEFKAEVFAHHKLIQRFGIN